MVQGNNFKDTKALYLNKMVLLNVLEQFRSVSYFFGLGTFLDLQTRELYDTSQSVPLTLREQPS